MSELETSLGILERTPRVLEALLGGLDEGLVTADYGIGTFSPYNVVGHLIIGEKTDWVPRASIILEHGPGRPFDPFDHTATIERSEERRVGERV